MIPGQLLTLCVKNCFRLNLHVKTPVLLIIIDYYHTNIKELCNMRDIADFNLLIDDKGGGGGCKENAQQINFIYVL